LRQYIIRRVLISLIVLFGVSVMLYTLVRCMPSDYVALSTANSQKVTEEMKANLRAIYGLDKPIWAGYLDWLWNAVRGNLGTSLMFKRPVAEIIAEYAPVTFSVAAIALVLELLVAIPLGVLAARKQYSKADYVITTCVFIGISLPIFFFAAILKRIFGFYGLNWLPVSGMLTARVTYDGFTFAKFVDYAKHLVLPITCFVITGCGGMLRYTRTNMLEALSSDYVRTARAKGVPEHTVVYSHAFRNTLIPIVTLLGASLPSLFSGAAVTEGIFALEGLGNIALRASSMADVPYLMGFNMFLAVLTVLGYLVSDILYAVVDPRVRLS
jgi:peptide/nickel transport system permease protein